MFHPNQVQAKVPSATTAISIIANQQQRVLTLRQLRDLINDIYQQKTKFDQKCEDNRLPRETMEQFMYTYLN